jgi:hypothetical protein
MGLVAECNDLKAADKALTEATEVCEALSAYDQFAQSLSQYETAISQLPDDLRDGTPNLRAITPMILYLYRAQCVRTISFVERLVRDGLIRLQGSAIGSSHQ